MAIGEDTIKEAKEGEEVVEEEEEGPHEVRQGHFICSAQTITLSTEDIERYVQVAQAILFSPSLELGPSTTVYLSIPLS